MDNLTKQFIGAEELSKIMDVSIGHAYKIIRKLNNELLEKGFIIVAGKVSCQYMEERYYGLQQKESSII